MFQLQPLVILLLSAFVFVPITSSRPKIKPFPAQQEKIATEKCFEVFKYPPSNLVQQLPKPDQRIKND
jgi:hypothetical protein